MPLVNSFPQQQPSPVEMGAHESRLTPIAGIAEAQTCDYLPKRFQAGTDKPAAEPGLRYMQLHLPTEFVYACQP
jgi:hypothetical protein